MEQKVRQFLRAKISAGTFSGASVVFGKPSKKLISIHEGHLSNEVHTLVNKSTVFDLQSMTKALVTSAICLQLQEDNKLQLDSTIDSYLPFHGPQNLRNQGITFKHLLTHSSGLSDMDIEGEFKTTFAFWQKIFSAPLHFKPGSSIEYSDLGYRVLGKLIELELNETLESIAHRLFFSKLDRAQLSYHPIHCFNVAGCPNAHGLIDDTQVRALGGVVGCDGLFGGAESIFDLVSYMMTPNNQHLTSSLLQNTVNSSVPVSSYFDALAVGAKTLGWEVNPGPFSYAGRFHSAKCFEKAGGAGTFIWFDQASGYIFVYLTNHGKPVPFDASTWNRLVADIAPHTLSDIIYETK